MYSEVLRCTPTYLCVYVYAFTCVSIVCVYPSPGSASRVRTCSTDSATVCGWVDPSSCGAFTI